MGLPSHSLEGLGVEGSGFLEGLGSWFTLRSVLGVIFTILIPFINVNNHEFIGSYSCVLIKQAAVENKVLLTLLSDLIYSIGRHCALQNSRA
ncbi:hypothetical protein [Endozoicomonas ascidiicola]|uniref:hypothetical protein n=1 Tax=Endozoicomonas ascidiicola TaxID=1698521 RepID=UPI00082FC8F8|nr:hypothetical protein [Endozoicomonas ascidiicola]